MNINRSRDSSNVGVIKQRILNDHDFFTIKEILKWWTNKHEEGKFQQRHKTSK